MRYAIVLSYDGSGFCGWQIQPDAPSVQGDLEQALAMLLREKVGVVGAGRTDTGVNASYYVAHFDCDVEILDTETLAYKLNCVLSPGIAVSSIRKMEDGDFHARFSAVRRTYRYYVHIGKDPFIEKNSYRYPFGELDFGAMNLAAQALKGTKDFSCFEKSGGDNKTSICTVFEAGWHRYCPEPGCSGQCWYFEITADRFLRNMVRAIVGTLLEVGRGRRSAASIPELLDSGDRCEAGQSVPGHALFLYDVAYPEAFGLSR